MNHATPTELLLRENARIRAQMDILFPLKNPKKGLLSGLIFLPNSEHSALALLLTLVLALHDTTEYHQGALAFLLVIHRRSGTGKHSGNQPRKPKHSSLFQNQLQSSYSPSASTLNPAGTTLSN